jgi:hypothetical protein
LAADQANVAATKDATYTSGSVDLEGVPEDDKTTYTFKTDADPPAAGGSSDISPRPAQPRVEAHRRTQRRKLLERHQLRPWPVYSLQSAMLQPTLMT